MRSQTVFTVPLHRGIECTNDHTVTVVISTTDKGALQKDMRNSSHSYICVDFESPE